MDRRSFIGQIAGLSLSYSGVVQALASDDLPAMGTLFLEQGGIAVAASQEGHFDQVDMQTRFTLRHVVSSSFGDPDSMAALAVQSTRISDVGTGLAANLVFCTMGTEAPGEQPETARSATVDLADYTNFHLDTGIPIARSSRRNIQEFCHTTLQPSTGLQSTLDARERFVFPPVVADSRKIVRSITLLRFRIIDGYELQFDAGPYSADVRSIQFDIFAINYNVAGQFVVVRA